VVGRRADGRSLAAAAAAAAGGGAPVVLLTQLLVDPSAALLGRRSELVAALRANLANPLVQQVVLLTEGLLGAGELAQVEPSRGERADSQPQRDARRQRGWAARRWHCRTSSPSSRAQTRRVK
jgi:hypothetical protein